MATQRAKNAGGGPVAAEAQAGCAGHAAPPLTELRRMVLELVQQAERPLTAYQLLDRLKQTRKGAMPPTVYRALDYLIEHKLIHKVATLNVFVPCEAGHHEHAIQFLICHRCGQVQELEDVAVGRTLEQAARKAGFTPTHSIVEVAGECASCAAQMAGAAA